MLLNRPLKDILRDIGHDGSEIWFPDEPDPKNRRGFTTQEFIDVAYYHGIAMIEILQPEYWDGTNLDSRKLVEEFPFHGNFEQRILYYMQQADGLITGRYNMESVHMVAWDHVLRRVHDPSYRGVYEFDNDPEPIIIESFLPIFKIKSP
jgi:hypothetical protein